MMLEYTKLECGCSNNVIDEEYAIHSGEIINNWITEIWAQLSLHKEKVQVND
jgi:hypothetical protein